MSFPKRFEIYLVHPGQTQGAEMRKPRPWVIVSPDELNQKLATVIAIPLTSVRRGWPFRVSVAFQGKQGDIALDQIRAVDKQRLLRLLGFLDESTGSRLLGELRNLFDT